MSIDTTLTLVKCITLLYRESTMKDRGDHSAEMVKALLDQVKLPELAIAINDQRALLIGLKATALYLCENIDHPIDKTDLLQRLRVNCANEDKVYATLVDGIDMELDEAGTKSMVISIRRGLKEAMREEAATSLVAKAHKDLGYARTRMPVKRYIQELIRQLEPYQTDTSNTKDPAIVGEINIAQPETITAALEEMQSVENHAGILKTGWQAMNTMLQGGFRPGEQWVTPALQHKWKTGLTLTLFRQLAEYNTPTLIDPAKKPLLVRISFEDNLYTNVRFLYESIYFNKHGDMPDIRAVPVAEMALQVKTTMEATGFHVRMLRVNSSLWTYQDLQNYIIGLEAEGYEVKACILDYLPMLPTTGCEEGPQGHALQDLYRRTRNFFSARKAVLITPHQLSTDAKQLVRDGAIDFVKQLPGKGYYRGSKQIDQEVDGEIYIHLEKVNGKTYLAVQRGKHRGVPVIPDEDQYFILPFPEIGPIPDDVGKKRIDRKHPGGGERGSVDEVPFFE